MLNNRGHIYYNGKDLADYGLYVSGSGIQTRPEKDVSFIEVPGRNGDIAINNNRYKNISITYPGFIVGKRDVLGNQRLDFNLKMQGLYSWLLRPDTYVRLEDSYNPDYFRMAMFTSPGDVQADYLRAAQFDLSFNCKPQRYLKTGDESTTYTEDSALHNPFMFPALPMMRVYGYGYLYIGDYAVQIAQHNYPYIDIDCERQDAYCDTSNCNPVISVTEFPRLEPGDSAINFSSTISRVQIIPRWWTL